MPCTSLITTFLWNMVFFIVSVLLNVYAIFLNTIYDEKIKVNKKRTIRTSFGRII